MMPFADALPAINPIQDTRTRTDNYKLIGRMFYPGVTGSITAPWFRNMTVRQGQEIVVYHLDSVIKENADIYTGVRVAKGVNERVLTHAKALEKEFHSLVNQWRLETGFLSSLSAQFTHPAYQRIMAMGTEGLPLVLNELKNGSPDNWFYALKYMAGEDGKNIASGIQDFEEARAIWLEWGYGKNHI